MNGMNNQNRRMKSGIIAAIVICSVVVLAGVGFVAYKIALKSITSGGNQGNAQAQWGSENGDMPNMEGGMPDGQRMPGGMGFSQFVEDGIIDQDTADEMQTYMEDQMEEQRENGQNGGAPGSGTDMFSEIFDGMVDEGILTQEQADEIQEAMPQPGSGNMPEGFSSDEGDIS